MHRAELLAKDQRIGAFRNELDELLSLVAKTVTNRGKKSHSQATGSGSRDSELAAVVAELRKSGLVLAK